MLDTHACQDYYDTVCRTAKGTGLWSKLEKRLQYLDSFRCSPDHPEATQCRLFHSAQPLSFAFHMFRKENGHYEFWFVGALMFQPPVPGSEPPQPAQWKVHT